MASEAVFFPIESELQPLPGRPVAVLETCVYRGPHRYSHTPMIRIQLDLGRMEDWPTNHILGFTAALLDLLPGLREHHCCFNRRGGFVRRLEEGTWLGHVAEHIALELQTRAGHRVTRGKTRSVKGRHGVYDVMFAYREEAVGLMAGRIALEIVDSILPDDLRGMDGLERIAPLDRGFDFTARLEELERLARSTSFGPTTQSLVDEARRRGIPVMRLDDASLLQFGHGRHQQRIRASVTGRTPMVAVEIAGNKDLTKRLLAESGVPVPRGAVVRDEAGALREAARLGYPLVTKPLDGNHGRGVTIGIASEEQLRFGIACALGEARRGGAVVEQHLAGRDYRILVVGGSVVAVAERVPAHVVGDGLGSIRQLVARANSDPRRGNGHEKPMTRIRIDAAVTEFIGRSGLTPETVPAAGMRVQLTPTANLSTGGTATDRTNEIHPDNAEIARRAAAVVGLDIAGIDFIAPDITRSVRETGGGVVEVNAAPGFRMHLEPFEGPPRDVARPVMEMLFPRGTPSRIPIVAITGTNGKSTVGRMVKHVLQYTGCTVGLTSTSGVYVNDVMIADGDAAGPKSARMILRDPNVDIAVLETARGGMLREGLAFDEAEIGVVLNVSADHLGLKGIETLEDLADAKSLVVEAVGRGGTSILNADDPLTRAMERRAGGRILWFSLNGGDELPDFLREHVDAGGMAVVREPGPGGGTIAAYRNGRREVVVQAADIPATLHGAAAFNIANALAAIGICLAQGVPVLTLRTAMMTFQSSFEQNPGRLNIHDAHGFRVILDYAHNPAGMEAIGDLVALLRDRYVRTLGVISIPGDRRDEDIIAMGRIAAGVFDEMFFREDPSTRGRPRGEIMNLLRQGALAAGASGERIHLIAGEAAATDAGLKSARPGDLLVITPSDVAAGWNQVVEFQPDQLRAAAPLLAAAE